MDFGSIAMAIDVWVRAARHGFIWKNDPHIGQLFYACICTSAGCCPWLRILGEQRIHLSHHPHPHPTAAARLSLLSISLSHSVQDRGIMYDERTILAVWGAVGARTTPKPSF
jgi:hypothetical protein